MTTIYDINGNAIVSVEPNKGSKRSFTLMKEDYVLLKFSLASPLHFGIGSYIENDLFGRFEITDFQQPKRDQKSGAWQYELQFNATYLKWKNKIFKYTPQNESAEVSWSLTASLNVQLGVFLQNLTALGYTFNGSPYDFSIDGTVADEAKVMTYDGVTLYDALIRMAESWETEVWVTENVIHFGRCEFGDAITFDISDNVAEMTAESARTTFATRLYAYGSDRNLPTSYRPTSEGVVVNGVVQKRLMLPEDTPYIDAYPTMATEEAVEAVVVFDEIYPRVTSTLSDVTTKEYDSEDEDGVATGEKWNAYRYKDTSMTFSEDYILPNEPLEIIFQTGSLAGMTFAVKFNPLEKSESESEAQLWEIIRNETYGRPLPDDVLKPKNGDEFILTGWDSTKISQLGLVDAAEQELKAKALETSARLKVDPMSYRCKMVSAKIAQESGFSLYSLGDKVLLVNGGLFATGSRNSRIIGYEFDFAQPYNTPTYIVGEQAAYSKLGDLASKVETLTLAGQTFIGGNGSSVYIIRTNDNTPASDTNVYSALRTKRDFLSRVLDDIALGKITFSNGLDALRKATFKDTVQFGLDFASGPTGFGGQIDRNAHGELESLSLRSWLEVPEIRYNRAEVILGDQWRAAGGGIIESVEPDADANGNTLRTGTINLKLEDGEIGAIAVDDICKGYFHDFATPSNNAAADSDDSRGNTEFSGFCTIYFRVTEIIGSDGVNKTFRYALRPESERWRHSFHPFEGMHFVAYGSFSDTERQKSAYSTRTYTRHLKGVNDWEFTSAMITMQFGDLSNLSVYGLDMSGYSAYLQNIYLTGTIQDVEIEAPVELQVETSTGDTFIADGESLALSCSVRKAWQDLTSEVQAWTIARDSGDATADSAWNAAHTGFAGAITLTQADIGATTLNANSLFTITATDGDWTASKTLAIRTLRLPASLSMRFISEYGAQDTFISFGDRVKFQAVVEDGLRNDYTANYDQWLIVRHNGDSADEIASDSVWNATRASISSTGVFYIEWSASHDDLQAERATFVITAQISNNSATAVTGTLSL